MSLAELLAEMESDRQLEIRRVRTPGCIQAEWPAQDWQAKWIEANRGRVLAALGGTEIENAVQFRRNACVAEYVNERERVWVFGATP